MVPFFLHDFVNEFACFISKNKYYNKTRCFSLDGYMFYVLYALFLKCFHWFEICFQTIYLFEDA